MATKLLCKNLISQPKLYRSMVHYTKIRDRSSFVAMGCSGWDPISGAKYIWLKDFGCSNLQASACNGLLETYLKIELTPKIAGPFLAQFVLRGAVPNLLTFSLVTKSYCKQFRYQRVLDAVLIQMKALGVEASISFYKNLMSWACVSFGPVVAYGLLKNVRASHRVEMPLSCYNVLVPQFIKRKHIYHPSNGEVFVKLVIHMKRHRVFPDQKLVDCFLKARYIYDDLFKRAEGMTRQMFAQGIKIGVVQRVEW